MEKNKEEWIEMKTIIPKELSTRLQSLLAENKFDEYFSNVEGFDESTRKHVYALEYKRAKAIHWAAHHGNLDALARLLKSGICVETVDSVGQTALHYAAGNNQCQMIIPAHSQVRGPKRGS